MTRRFRGSLRTLIVTLVLGAAFTTLALACGPFFAELRTVERGVPSDRQAYDRGNLGIVKPTFARRYLVQAYRTLSGAAPQRLDPQPRPVADTGTASSAGSAPLASGSAVDRWQEAVERIIPTGARAQKFFP